MARPQFQLSRHKWRNSHKVLRVPAEYSVQPIGDVIPLTRQAQAIRGPARVWRTKFARARVRNEAQFGDRSQGSEQRQRVAR